MAINRIFICHAIRSENQEETKIFLYVTEVLQKAGMEIVTHEENESAENLAQLLQTCQTFLLLQTPDAVYAPWIGQIVEAALKLAERKTTLKAFRFICSLMILCLSLRLSMSRHLHPCKYNLEVCCKSGQ